jgi:hypothetical protein
MMFVLYSTGHGIATYPNPPGQTGTVLDDSYPGEPSMDGEGEGTVLITAII